MKMKSIGSDDHSYSERAARGELDVEKGEGGPDCIVEPTLVDNDTSWDHDGNVMELRSTSMNKTIDKMPMYKRIRVEISGMNAYVPDIFAKPSLREKLDPLGLFRKNASDTGKKQKMKQILFDVSGTVYPGEVLALMGPSGSGKTTLLSIAAGRAQSSMKTTGLVTFNGCTLDKPMKRRIGYVMQDDLLYEALTVRETLYYAAMLRLPRSMPHQEKLDRIDTVLNALGLTKCKDTIVGGFFRRGISGGERKRTSVGYELLINPAILFLDEPTSGLDSTTSYSLLGTLRELASGGRTIVTTIHQPSSRLYQQLDKLMLLSQGHIMYFGRAADAVDYFELLGYPIPPRVNAADFILDLSSGEIANSKAGLDDDSSRNLIIKCTETFLKCHPLDGFELERDGASVKKLEEIIGDGEESFVEDWFLTQEAKANTDVSSDEADIGSKRSYMKSDGASEFGNKQTSSLRAMLSSGKVGNMLSFKSSKSQLQRSDSFYVNGDDSRWGASYWGQVGYLFERNLRTRRFESVSSQDVFLFLTLAVLAGLFWLQKGQGDTIIEARDTVGILFFMLMFLSFRSLFVSLFTFPEEQRHMLKERASGMYRLSAFYVARTLSDFPTDMSIPTGFVIVVYFMAGLRYTAGAFFGTYGTLLLSMLVAQSLGLLLGAIFMNPKTAQAVATVLMLTIVLTAGYFVTDIPDWIEWIQWLSYIYYALGIMLHVQFDAGKKEVYSCTKVDLEANKPGECSQIQVDNPANDSSCTLVKDLEASLGLLQDPTSTGDAVRNGMILLSFLIAIRIVVYFVLKRKTVGL